VFSYLRAVVAILALSGSCIRLLFLIGVDLLCTFVVAIYGLKTFYFQNKDNFFILQQVNLKTTSIIKQNATQF